MTKSRSPIKDLPLRLPGQSLEEEREKIIEDVVGPWTAMAVSMIGLAVFEWYRWVMDVKPTPVIFTVAAVVVTAIAVSRIWMKTPQLKKLRLALQGERVVGQYLERVRALGYDVFHDVVGDGFNVDHVVIGPTGVYTIETKTWSKPLRGPAVAVYDGMSIRVGGQEKDRDPVAQARAQADWIRGLLRESTGRDPSVRPVVLIPGWFIESTRDANRGVWVLEPKAFPSFLEHEPVKHSAEDTKLFCFHLSRAIRTSEASRAG